MMADCAEAGGLCACCTLRDHCTFPRAPGLHVRFCEEFTPIAPSPNRAVARRGLLAPEETIAAAQDHKGLCCNCAHRGGCTFTRPDCGVLQCEEYL